MRSPRGKRHEMLPYDQIHFSFFISLQSEEGRDDSPKPHADKGEDAHHEEAEQEGEDRKNDPNPLEGLFDFFLALFRILHALLLIVMPSLLGRALHALHDHSDELERQRNDPDHRLDEIGQDRPQKNDEKDQ